MKTLRRSAIAAACGIAMLVGAPAVAQQYPTRPVNFIVPFAAGGSLDALTRIIGEGMSKELGQPVTMDFRPGQGGYVGADALGKSKPDGYTVGMIASTHAVGRSVYAKVPVDITTLAHIGHFLRSPFVLVVHPAVEARSVKELAQAAIASPGKLNAASSGNGSSAHLLIEMLKRAAKADIVHVPYKAGSAATTDLIAGHVQMYFELASFGVANARAGKVRALGVTGPQRLPALPDVPTMREAGFPTVELVGWGGLSAPAGTPPAVVARLGEVLRGVVNAPETRARFGALHSEAAWLSGEEFAAFVRSESERLGAVVRDANIKVD